MDILIEEAKNVNLLSTEQLDFLQTQAASLQAIKKLYPATLTDDQKIERAKKFNEVWAATTAKIPQKELTDALVRLNSSVDLLNRIVSISIKNVVALKSIF